MKHDELREAVARAIYACVGSIHTQGERMFEPVLWEELDDDDYQCVRSGFREQADAALAVIREALKEPTPEMVAATRNARMNIEGGYGGPSSWEAGLTASPLYPEK